MVVFKCAISVCHFIFSIFAFSILFWIVWFFKIPYYWIIINIFLLFSGWCKNYKIHVIILVYFKIMYHFFCCIKSLKIPFSFSSFVLFFNHIAPPLYDINYIIHYCFVFVNFLLKTPKVKKYLHIFSVYQFHCFLCLCGD